MVDRRTFTCGVSAPVAGSILNALAKCLSPAMPAEPGPPLLETTT
jgi:hypothetical protein